MKKNYGFVKPKLDPTHYALGGFISLPQTVLQPDGDWMPFVPDFEPQRKQFECYNCTGYATEKNIRILLKRLGIEENYSARWIGIIAGTKPPGNDPHTVAEAIRKNGLIPESILPFSDDLQSVDEYYSFKGADEAKCREEGRRWLENWDFGHEWVFQTDGTQDKMLEALTYSPLGVSVDAWNKNGDVFVKTKGEPDNHWTACVVGAVKDKYWIIADTYLDDGQPLKHLAWDYPFGFCKRYSLTAKTALKISFIKRILTLLSSLLAFIRLHPDAKPTDVVGGQLPSLLDIFCLAIRDVEGNPGDRNYRNNNPGNCRYSPVGYLPIYGVVRKDKDGFAIFKDYATGWLYLRNLIKSKASQHPTYTILDYFAKIHAPASDGNNPTWYANFVAKRCNVATSFLIKNLL